MKRLSSKLILLCAMLMPCVANASIISATGPVEIISAPASVDHNVLQSDTFIRAFDELNDVLLNVPLTTNGGPDGQFSPVTLDAGTRVASHLLHVDPEQAVELNHIYDATVTFNTRIAGFFYINSDLDATDSLLGLSGTIYPYGFFSRGAGSAVPGSDKFSVSLTDPNVLVIGEIPTGFKGGEGSMDQIRVLTYVPVPAALWLFISGFAVLIPILRKRR